MITSTIDLSQLIAPALVQIRHSLYFSPPRVVNCCRGFPSPFPAQVPLLPVVPRPSSLQREGDQRQPLQQNPQRVRSGVQNHQGPRAAAEAETSRPPGAQQNPGQDDHGHERTCERLTHTHTPTRTPTSSNTPSCFIFSFCSLSSSDFHFSPCFSLILNPPSSCSLMMKKSERYWDVRQPVCMLVWHWHPNLFLDQFLNSLPNIWVKLNWFLSWFNLGKYRFHKQPTSELRFWPSIHCSAVATVQAAATTAPLVGRTATSPRVWATLRRLQSTSTWRLCWEQAWQGATKRPSECLDSGRGPDLGREEEVRECWRSDVDMLQCPKSHPEKLLTNNDYHTF